MSDEHGYNYTYNDGGRAAAGFTGIARDCAARAMAIALSIPYMDAYKELAKANKEAGLPESARNGMYKKDFEKVLNRHGWVWFPAPRFPGRKAVCADLYRECGVPVAIARQAGHFVAVKYGQPHDIFDSSQKMVYGYWAKKGE